MDPNVVLIIANIISFIGNALFTSSSLFKRKKTIILLQSSNHILSTIAQAMQQAYSGMIQDGLLLIKNIVLLFIKEEKRILKLIINIVIIALGVIGGVLVNVLLNDNVWYGYLPVIGIFVFSVSSTLIFFVKSWSLNKQELVIKLALIFNGALWCVYGVLVQLYPITIFNSLTIILSTIAIIRIIISVSKNKENVSKEIEDINKQA